MTQTKRSFHDLPSDEQEYCNRILQEHGIDPKQIDVTYSESWPATGTGSIGRSFKITNKLNGRSFEIDDGGRWLEFLKRGLQDRALE